MPEQRKREIAYKVRISDILRGNPIIEERTTDEGLTRENFRFLELDKKEVVRINLVANLIDKYISEGVKHFATITLDDASGQIRVKVFGDDVKKFDNLNQGDTLLIIGVLRSFNKEVYILPEIIKKTDPRYLLVRKLEIEKSLPVKPTPEMQAKTDSVRDKIINLVKSSEEAGGIDIEQIILEIKETSPDAINTEITKLLEDGAIYEPRPGRVRWLG